MSSSLRKKLEHTFLARDGARWESFYFDNFYSAFSEEEQTHLLSPKLQPEIGDPYTGSMAFWNQSSGTLLQRLLYTDIKTYLVELLMKQDNMSMAASVESRVPFLDHKVVEFALSIPSQYSIRALSGKRVLQEIAHDLLPASILHRRKMGFPTPWSGWLAGRQLDELEQTLAAPRSAERGFLQPETLKRLFAEHRAGVRDNTDRIWRLLNLELWTRIFIDRDPAAFGSRESDNIVRVIQPA
jgi:asparagine synthase (glutamine-hydrolysing)